MCQCLPRSPDQSVLFQGSDVSTLHIKFTKAVCMFKVSGGSLWPLTGLRKECYLLAPEEDNLVFTVGQVFLVKTWGRCTVHPGETGVGKGGTGRQAEKRFAFKFSLSCPNIWIFISSPPHVFLRISTCPSPFKLGFLVPQIREQNIKFNTGFF